MCDPSRPMGAALLSKLEAPREHGFTPRPEQRLPDAPAERIHRACRSRHPNRARLDKSLSHPGRGILHPDSDTTDGQRSVYNSTGCTDGNQNPDANQHPICDEYTNYRGKFNQYIGVFSTDFNLSTQSDSDSNLRTKSDYYFNLCTHSNSGHKLLLDIHCDTDVYAVTDGDINSYFHCDGHSHIYTHPDSDRYSNAYEYA